jgi:hypothetical protein
MYLSYAFSLGWQLDSPSLVRECYIILTLKEDLSIENPGLFIENPQIFPYLLNIYLIAMTPAQSMQSSLMQVIDALS